MDGSPGRRLPAQGRPVIFRNFFLRPAPAGGGGVGAELGGRVGSRGLASARVGELSCFLRPPKFQGRNPTIPIDPTMDAGRATGNLPASPTGPTPTPAERTQREAAEPTTTDT